MRVFQRVRIRKRCDGIILVDEVPVFRVIQEPDAPTVIQFVDPNNFRASRRGSKVIEVTLEELLHQINDKNV